MNWTEFVSACKTFLKLSQEQGDSWREEGDAQVPGEYFISLRTLRRRRTTTTSSKTSEDAEDGGGSQPQLLTCRFDVIFSLSYGVPMMYFTMSNSDGSCLTIEEIWDLIKVSSTDLWSTVSQMDHPLLQIPFFAFHACQTEKLMETLCSSSSSSKETNSQLFKSDCGNEDNSNKKSLQPYEYLISWLSFMASILQFDFSQQYILHCSSFNNSSSCSKS